MRRLLLLFAAWVLVMTVILFSLLTGARIEQMLPVRAPASTILLMGFALACDRFNCAAVLNVG